MSKEIYLDAPDIKDNEKKYLLKALDSGFVSTIGPLVPEFENKFADYLNIKKAVSTQSGTAALHISLYELGIKVLDEVIVPALTFIASVNPVVYVGATPVFVDVEPDTWNIDPDDLENKITAKTRAIIPVHLYGNPCNMDKIMRIAKKYNLYVIEDATESLGALYNDKYTGTFGNMGCFSFNGNKVLTTGGGGMVVGNSDQQLGHIKFLVNQARDESKGYYHPEIGFNYRMTNLEAALGLAQLERLSEFLEKKKKMGQIYRNELSNIDSIGFQQSYDNAKSSFWLNTIIFKESLNIESFREKLKQKGIPTRRVFVPIPYFPPYKNFGKGFYENSFSIYERGLCLPSSTLNSFDDIYYVCKVIKELVN